MVEDKPLQDALDEITSRKQESRRFIRGYNDCWALVVAYDQNCGGSLWETDFGLFDSHRQFYTKVRKAGFSGLPALFKSHGYSLVRGRVQPGDIAYVAVPGAFPSAIIAGKKYWYSSFGTRDAGPYRKVRPIETELIYHVRRD